MKDDPIKSIRDPFKEIERSQQELERRIFHLKALYDLSQEIGFLRGTQEIIKNLLMMTMGTFGASNGFILLMNMNDARVETFTQRGFAKNALDPLSETLESEIFKALDQAAHVLILDKPEENWEEMENLLNLLSSLSIKIWIPFAINSQLKGSIALGEKLSGDSYTLEDLELLSTMTHQGAVAIENAQLVDQMKSEETVRTNLARYLSPQIVEQIIKKNVQVNLGGNRKVVTVLFSDIRNFTRISEALPPDKLVHLLNEYFTEMARIIFENQGSLDKYIGDAIVAVFGSLIPLENPARTAVQAAIQMIKELSSLNQRWKSQYGFTMEIGVGSIQERSLGISALGKDGLL
jgi:adenylate cyclase